MKDIMEEESSGRHTSSADETSGVITEESHDDVKEARQVAEKETKRLRFWRFVVTDVLIFIGVTVSLSAYAILREKEEQSLSTAFDEFTEMIGDATMKRQQVLRDTLISFAASASTSAVASNASWPTFTPRFLEKSAIGFRAVSPGVRSVTLNPIVRSGDDANKWIAYATNEHERVVEENRRIAVSPSVFRPVRYQRSINRYLPDSDIFFRDDGSRDYFFPSLAWSPPPNSYKAINWDIGSIEIFDSVIQSLMTTFPQEVLLSAPLNRSHVPFDLQANPEPLIYAFGLVHQDPNNDASPPVALVSAGFSWRDEFRSLLPSHVDGVVAVVESDSCDSTHSYQIDGHEATFLGTGDKHDAFYDKYIRTVELGIYSDPTAASTEGHCRYRLVMYPNKSFASSYKSPFPEICCVVLFVTFLGIAIVYFKYDVMVDARNEKLITRFARSNAIVSSLFPRAFQERLMTDGSSDSHGHKKGYGNLKSLMSAGNAGNSNGHDHSKPLADFFADVSICMADVVGFTAWSSVREPSQVFILLETLYAAFDENANARRIFKVETVGDCYVAASGMPQPRKDHAVAMVRFAIDILHKFQVVTRELEVKLGPDTADLSLRVGVHSGPVTAGVLRGQKARFQLFGDSMNVTARIEATGMPGRIHISQSAAENLMKAGKMHWLKKRSDMVNAKGKGAIQTYWVVTGDDSKDGASTTTSSSRQEDDSSHVARKKKNNEKLHCEGLEERSARLVDWNVEILLRLIKQIIARREAMAACNANNQLDHAPGQRSKSNGHTRPLEEVQEIIALPEFDHDAAQKQKDRDKIEIPRETVEQLKAFVTTIASLYRESNPFHNFEHASHVMMSVTKLLSRIVAPTELDTDGSENSEAGVAAMLHDHTYGITSDPLTQFACCFSALIHDVDHSGVPNAQLVKEGSHLASYYSNRSVAEQNSFDLSFALFLDDTFQDLRLAVCATDAELDHFRRLVVNAVMATDIVDKELKGLRNARWEKAFAKSIEFDTDTNYDSPQGRQILRDSVNRKATIVIEHLIQASDVAHTMQHWHVYRKWNEFFFLECFKAWHEGRADKDPTDGWYEGEIGFFDFYIIPLAKKLKDCGVFGVSSDEYLTYAQSNRDEWEARGKEVVAEISQRANREIRCMHVEL